MYNFYIKNYIGENGNVVYSETLVYSVPITDEDAAFSDPEIKCEMGKAGSLEFKVYPNNRYYRAWREMLTIIRVEFGNITIFRGRVITANSNFYGEKTIHCEGDLAFLLDSQQEGKKDADRQSVSASSFLQAMISEHNAQMTVGQNIDGADKCFTLSEVPGQYTNATGTSQRIANETKKYGSSSWKDTLSALEDLQKECGGYFRTRWSNGVCYLDWLEESFSKEINPQPIEIGMNLIDISKSTEVENIFTVLIPIGTTKGRNGSPLYITGRIMTVPSIVSHYTDAELNTGYHAKTDYETAIQKYGRIYKTEQFQNATTEAELIEYARDFIKTNYKGGLNSFSVTALDIHHIDDNERPLLEGDKVAVIYPDMDNIVDGKAGLIRKELTIISATLRPHTPEKNEYQISIPSSTRKKTYGISSITASSSSDIGSSIIDIDDLVQKLMDELTETQNALADLSWEYVQDAAQHNVQYYNFLQQYPQYTQDNYTPSDGVDPLQTAHDIVNVITNHNTSDGPIFHDMWVDLLMNGPPDWLSEYKSNPDAFLRNHPTYNRELIEKLYWNYLATTSLVVSANNGGVFAQLIQNQTTNPDGTPNMAEILRLAYDPDWKWRLAIYNALLDQNGRPFANGEDPTITLQSDGLFGAVFGNFKMPGSGNIGVSINGATGSVNVASTLSTLFGADGGLDFSAITNMFPGFSQYISGDSITGNGLTILSTLFPQLSETLSGLQSLDLGSLASTVASQIIPGLGGLFGEGGVISVESITAAVSGISGFITGEGDTAEIIGSGVQLLLSAFPQLANLDIVQDGKILLSDLKSKVSGLFQSQTPTTVEINGNAGTANIGRTATGDWSIKLNDTITYTGSDNQLHTLSGVVTAADFNVPQVGSFKTAFAAIDVILANYVKANEIAAYKAVIDQLTTNVGYAGTIYVGSLQADALSGSITGATIYAANQLSIGATTNGQGSGSFYFQGQQYGRKKISLGTAPYISYGYVLKDISESSADINLNHTHSLTMQEITSGDHAGQVQATLGAAVAETDNSRISFFDIAASATCQALVAAAANNVQITGPIWSSTQGGIPQNAQATFSTNASTPNTKNLNLYLVQSGGYVQLKSDSANGDTRAQIPVSTLQANDVVLYHYDTAPGESETGPHLWTSTINGAYCRGASIRVVAGDGNGPFDPNGGQTILIPAESVNQNTIPYASQLQQYDGSYYDVQFRGPNGDSSYNYGGSNNEIWCRPYGASTSFSTSSWVKVRSNVALSSLSGSVVAPSAAIYNSQAHNNFGSFYIKVKINSTWYELQCNGAYGTAYNNPS